MIGKTDCPCSVASNRVCCVDATMHDQAAPTRIIRGEAAVLEVFQWPDATFIFLA